MPVTQTNKDKYLQALAKELDQPGKALFDAYLIGTVAAVISTKFTVRMFLVHRSRREATDVPQDAVARNQAEAS